MNVGNIYGERNPFLGFFMSVSFRSVPYDTFMFALPGKTANACVRMHAGCTQIARP